MHQLTQHNAQSDVDVLRLTDSNSHFLSSILKILIEDHREGHVERFNNKKDIVQLVVGDIVMARTAVQSDASTNKVAKLSYQVRGPFCIVTCTGRGSYFVRKFYKPDSATLKFTAVDLYPLPPFLKLCEPVDSSGTRYLNQPYSPVVNPLRKSLNIELCNETWFDKPPRTSKSLFDYVHPTLTFSECSSSPFPSVSDLHNASKTPCVPPLLEQFPDTDIILPFFN